MNKVLKAIMSCLGVIATGAIGSGVWEKFLSPAISAIAEFTASMLAQASESYSNSIYQNAAKVRLSDESYSNDVLLFLLAALALFAFALKSHKSNLFIQNFCTIYIEGLKGWNGVITSAILVVIYGFTLITNGSANNIRNNSLQNMEILRPYIEEKEYLKLRSDYMQITNKNDYLIFLKKIHDHSMQHDINITKTKII